MFREDDRKACASHGIDLDTSYRELLLEIRMGGPVMQRLLMTFDGLERLNTGRHLIDTGWHANNARMPIGNHKPLRSEQERRTLTATEREVLEGFAAGLSTAKIAQRRARSFDTVKEQAEHAKEKLAAKNMTHAVAIAIRAGLIEPPPVKSGRDV